MTELMAGPRAELVALHPEAVAEDDCCLRWVTDAASVPAVRGKVEVAPGDLGRLLAEGVLTAVEVEPGAVVTELRSGLSWRAEGPRVRTALHAALTEPAGWVGPAGAVAADPTAYAGAGLADADDLALGRRVEALLAGNAGALVRSHGGSVEVVSVVDGVVTLRLGGTCHGCPAMGATVGRHLAVLLRRECPGLREVVAVS